MMNVETIKQEIRKLIEKYNRVVEEKRVNKYNEEMTKKDFILPLFRALGWNTEDSKEVTAEEKISKKRVDYGFRINGIPKFFLEAKSLKEDLDNPKFIEQAINYAWHKGCTWAVLTDFESVKIFNAEWKTSNPLQSHLKTIPCQEFLDRFNELWLLSRESFEQGLIDKEAEKWGKKTKKTSVDKQILADFTRFRELLSKNITKLNQSKKLTEEDLDESIQRILDRLIFIRNCEDRELEAKTLISIFREWESRGKGQLIKRLREVFGYFDKQYNSKIFANHLCDSLDIDNEVLHEVIEGLYYTKDKSVYYDFSAIEADVLGNIYEQYLGHILKKSEKRAKITENHAHRKEQGIYYTPTYIVDYIVRNTLGELLKDKKINVEKIRVLDPACGSGSFLIKAFDVLNEYYAKHDKNYFQTQIDFKTGLPYTSRIKILKNNIFGVDLDRQAVEIAQLNLLLKIAEKGKRLPLLQENIKCGNSLIDDPAIAGDKAFKWEEEFPEVMKEGGFDVVIGNPPYVRPHNLDDKTKKYLWKNSKVVKAKGDIYAAFIEKGINLLRERGLISFIVPHTWLSLESFEDLRKYILNSCKIKSITILPRKVFQEAEVETLIFVFEKCRLSSLRNKNIFEIKEINESKELKTIGKKKQEEYINNRIFDISIGIKNDLLFKIEKETNKLSDLVNFFYGLKTADDKKFLTFNPKNNSEYKKLLRRRDFSRYRILFRGEYVYYKPELMIKNKSTARPGEPSRFEDDKIIIMDIAKKLVCTYDEDKYYIKDALILKEKSKDIKLKYLIALINSKLLNYYYKQKYKVLSVAKNAFLALPIKLVPESEQQPLITLVDKMLSLNKRLNEIGDKKTDERAKIEEEIKKTDAEIDELVYKIYGITEKEKKIIEESFDSD